ncbi:MAG: ABC transporter ATP-binding protein [Nocardioidaceae bacterium]|nr:ABC transporter ATP-binding protein [Nocardioidaceae bacterium]
MSAAVLQVRGLSAGYGRMTVVRDIDLEVAPGEALAVVGRNGVGKTTLLKAIAGVRAGSNSGQVLLDGADVSRAPADTMARRGLALVPEGHRVFGGLTVAENLMLGFFPWRRSRTRSLEESLARVHALFPILADFADRPAAALSGGQQQMVALGQALMASPRVLLVDEPSAGLAQVVIAEIYAALRTLRESGTAVVVVEQNLDIALRQSDRCLLVDNGRVVVAGRSEELLVSGELTETIHGGAR